MSLHEAPPVRSPAALQEDSKTPLKELFDRFHPHSGGDGGGSGDGGGPEYHAEKLASAPASEPMQWSCSLKCPTIVKPGSGEVLLRECTFQALGRGKHDAEQHCAHQALAHIASQAPQLGVKPSP